MTSKKKIPCRGDVYLVNFDPTLGSEIKKTRPAVIIQNDLGNRFNSITIVAPITSAKRKAYRVYVQITAPEGGLKKDSTVLLDQIRATDKQRLNKCLGHLSDETMARIDKALMISLGLEQYIL